MHLKAHKRLPRKIIVPQMDENYSAALVLVNRSPAPS